MLSFVLEVIGGIISSLLELIIPKKIIAFFNKNIYTYVLGLFLVLVMFAVLFYLLMMWLNRLG